MKALLSGILSILALSLSLASCGDSLSCAASLSCPSGQEASAFEEGSACQHSGHSDDGAAEDECPPSCHCSCCSSVAIASVLKPALSIPIHQPAQLLPSARHYTYDFHHLIWHPPQAG